MDSEFDIKFFDGYAVFRPSGHHSFHDAVKIISQGLGHATARRVNLLVDTTGLTGFPPPSIWQRFIMAEEWAGISRVCLAVVARPEMIDPERFGVIVAGNRGLIANVFTSEAESIEWILNPEPMPPPSRMEHSPNR